MRRGKLMREESHLYSLNHGQTATHHLSDLGAVHRTVDVHPPPFDSRSSKDFPHRPGKSKGLARGILSRVWIHALGVRGLVHVRGYTSEKVSPAERRVFFSATSGAKDNMNVRQFDARSGRLPSAPDGTRLVKMTFESCPGGSLSIRLARSVTPVFDRHGVSDDAWWKIECSGLPDRYFRTLRGSHSISELLREFEINWKHLS